MEQMVHEVLAEAAFEPLIRRFAGIIQTDPTTTDVDRAILGITIRQPGSNSISVLESRPLVRVDTSDRLRHTIRFSDESTRTRRARPKGVLGAEIRLTPVNPGEQPPTNPDALRYVALATGGVATIEFQATDRGKLAVYMLRWVGKRGVNGPWSEACAATVAA